MKVEVGDISTSCLNTLVDKLVDLVLQSSLLGIIPKCFHFSVISFFSCLEFFFVLGVGAALNLFGILGDEGFKFSVLNQNR